MTTTPLKDRRVLLAAGGLLLVLLVVGILWVRGDDTRARERPARANLPSVAGGRGLAAHDANGDGFVYQDAMHPEVVQDTPGRCPICGMELTRVPVLEGAAASGTVEIDPVTLQNLGVRTEIVQVAALDRQVRTTGTFEADERTREAVSLRVSGWIEELFVNAEGQRVRRGQPLLRVYSPDLVATQQEYLLAIRNREILGGSSGSDRLVEASRRRLQLFGVTDAQIQTLARTGRVQTSVTLFAPASGTVLEKRVVEGMEVRAGETLMELADLSRLWLQVAVPEQDLGWVRPGTTARIEVPTRPDAPMDGRVEFVYDTLDPDTRTGRARVVVPNPGSTLKAGMYATVTLVGGASGTFPVVSSDAVLRTSDEAVVIVALGGGRFRPQRVSLGEEAGGRVQILAGLQGGEQVVTRAQFLIDSEARLSGALAALDAGEVQPSGQPSPPDDVKTMLVDVLAADRNRDGFVFQSDATPHLLADRPDAVPGVLDQPTRVTIGAAQTALHRAGYRNVPVSVETADRNGDGFVYQDPMDWAVLHDGPGTCEVCRMQLQRVSLAQARQNLTRAGYTVRATSR
ncbi:MAG TPA: efflux RND transporter periplasmic adaptor subunit [Rhodothermales bacterium]|nr:efflux RND transporter periplasmic adaptor subunit [Rhodothermales bacterium]